MEFKASLSTAAKTITALSCIIFAFLIFTQEDNLARFMLLSVATVVFGATWAFSVKQYELTPDALVIVRRFGKKIIPLSQINGAEKIDRKMLRFTLRLFGNSGLFGYYGTFWSRRFGRMKWYVTDMAHTVLLTTQGNKKIVISPDDHEQFISSVLSAIRPANRYGHGPGEVHIL